MEDWKQHLTSRGCDLIGLCPWDFQYSFFFFLFFVIDLEFLPAVTEVIQVIPLFRQFTWNYREIKQFFILTPTPPASLPHGHPWPWSFLQVRFLMLICQSASRWTRTVLMTTIRRVPLIKIKAGVHGFAQHSEGERRMGGGVVKGSRFCAPPLPELHGGPRSISSTCTPKYPTSASHGRAPSGAAITHANGQPLDAWSWTAGARRQMSCCINSSNMQHDIRWGWGEEEEEWGGGG